MSQAGYTAFKLAMTVSPIILTRGIAQGVGGSLPIVAITEGANFIDNILTANTPPSFDQFFAHYKLMPGATLISNDIGTYPFANQATAANAIIDTPLSLSLRMIVPAKGVGGYAVKLATMTALKKTLEQHIFLGGTFSVITESYIYTDCLLRNMQDVSSGESKQDQYEWAWNFFKPLVSEESASAAYNTLMQKIKGGLPLTGQVSTSISGLLVGNAAASLLSSVTSIVVPQ